MPQHAPAPLARIVRIETADLDGNGIAPGVVEMEIVGVRGPPEHANAWDEALLVVEGSLLLRLGGDERTLGPGQGLHIPAQTPHAWESADGRAVRFVLVTAPGSPEEAADARAVAARAPSGECSTTATGRK